MIKTEHIDCLLNKLEYILQMSGNWEKSSPTDDQLSSSLPFAMDRLAPAQWLQWVFLPQMRRCLEHQALPSAMNLSPYFEEVWKDDQETLPIIEIIHAIDKVFEPC